MPESAGMQEVLEILRFGGRGLSILGKGLILLGKGAKKTWNLASLKKLQLQLAISNSKEATEANYNMLSIKTLEKITGQGRYGIVQIPTEDSKEIAEYCNMLKKFNIQASVMKDLNMGDGLTQIAFNPEQADTVNVVTERYNNMLLEKAGVNLSDDKLAHEITFDDYYKSADPKQKESFIKESAEYVESQQTPSISPESKGKENGVIDFATRKEKFKDTLNNIKSKVPKSAKDFYKFEVERTALVGEPEKGYMCKVPNSYDKNTNSFKLMPVPSDSVTFDGDKAIIYIKKDGESKVFDSKNRASAKKSETFDNKALFKDFFGKSKKTDSSTKTKTPTTPSHNKQK